MRGAVLGCQRVKEKLEVGLGTRIFLIEQSLQAEQLRGGDGDASVQQFADVGSHGNSRGAKHVLAFLVEHVYIVDDDTIEEPEVNSSQFHLRAEFPSQYAGSLSANVCLYCWDLQQYDDSSIDSHKSPQDAVDDVFQFLQYARKIKENAWKT